MKNPVASRIENQLNKFFESLDTTSCIKVSFILSKLDLNIVEQRNSVYNPENLIKLYIYKRIKGINSYYQLINKLTEDEITQLGFLKNENNKLQLPTKRHLNKFIEKYNLKLQLDNIAKIILKTATKNKIVLDLEVINKTIGKHKQKKNSNKHFKQAIKLVKQLIYPQINIQMRHNAKFTTKDLLDILTHVALTHDFCNNGTKTFQELYPDKKAPSGDTMLYHFGKLKARDEIEQTFEDIFNIIFKFSKQNYNILNQRKLDIAIDEHKIPYYGDKTDPFVIGGKQDRGTNQFFKFITSSIVVAGRRFTLDALPIHPLDTSDNLVDKLIKRAKNKIRIRHVYLDRGFDKASIIKVLKQNNIKYLMPKVRSSTVKQWYKKSEETKSRIIYNFKIADETTNLILVDDENGIKRAFSTNIKISEPIAPYLFRFYQARWGIETSYRNLEQDFKPRTTSKNYNIRLFYFLFSVCLYNLWILVNICISLKLYGRIKEKPLITAKLFAVILYRVSIDPGG